MTKHLLKEKGGDGPYLSHSGKRGGRTIFKPAKEKKNGKSFPHWRISFSLSQREKKKGGVKDIRAGQDQKGEKKGGDIWRRL